ncbi:MAG: ATP-dependent DNA helicase [Bacteroidota bacterium]
MLKNYLHRELKQNLEFEPTPGQEELLKMLGDFLSAPSPGEIFLIKGYAGTGKTTIVNSLVHTLTVFKQKSVLLAPTGRAAKVLSSYTSYPAFTIHKKIYRQKSGRDGLGRFVLDRNPHKNSIFIVDEASMIGDRSTDSSQFGSGDLLTDMLTYVESGNGCRLILIGDIAQLPPVGLEISPALDKSYLERMGYSIREAYLRDVVRQALDSGILENATRLRKQLEENEVPLPEIHLQGFPDIQRVEGAELIEELETSYSRYGEGETIVISRSNKRANKFNMGIRNQILWREEEISTGDLLMIVKNNYHWVSPEDGLDFIANGDIARLERIVSYHTLYNHRYADVIISLPDYKNLEIDARVNLDTLSIDTASMPLSEQKELYRLIMEDYADETDKKKQMKKLIEDPFFNALQIKYAYAVTCHKAQGGQWKSVFVDPGFFREDMINREYLRWLYTAFTRATEKLYLVNFPDEFFS